MIESNFVFLNDVNEIDDSTNRDICYLIITHDNAFVLKVINGTEVAFTIKPFYNIIQNFTLFSIQVL